MELKSRLEVAVRIFAIIGGFSLYSVNETLFLGTLFAAIGAYCYLTAYNFYNERRKAFKRQLYAFSVPAHKTGMLSVLTVTSVLCGFVFCSLAVDCLNGVFI